MKNYNDSSLVVLVEGVDKATLLHRLFGSAHDERLRFSGEAVPGHLCISGVDGRETKGDEIRVFVDSSDEDLETHYRLHNDTASDLQVEEYLEKARRLRAENLTCSNYWLADAETAYADLRAVLDWLLLLFF